MTRNEALLILNDHCGQEVEVIVQVDQGDTNVMVMNAKGSLHHWQHDDRAAAVWASQAREDLTGLYDLVGDAERRASVNITDLQEAWLLAFDDEPPYGLAFDLAEGVQLTLVWGVQ